MAAAAVMPVEPGGEASEVVEGRDGGHAPAERGQEEQLHPLDGGGAELVAAAGVELRQRRRAVLLHLGRHGHACHGEEPRRPRHRRPLQHQCTTSSSRPQEEKWLSFYGGGAVTEYLHRRAAGGRSGRSRRWRGTPCGGRTRSTPASANDKPDAGSNGVSDRSIDEETNQSVSECSLGESI